MDQNSRKFQTVDEYISTFPDDVQELLQTMRSTIKAAAPDAKEKISYNMPAFAMNSNLVYFGAAKNHIGFYPTASGIAAFQDELAQYEGSKGAIRFPLDEPLPLDLITRIVQYRADEDAGRALDKPGAMK